MIEETGKIVTLEGEYVWVETIREAACDTCSSKSACGQSVLEKTSLGKKQQIRALSTLNVAVGDEVVIGIEEPVILVSAVITYLLPLTCLFAFVFVSVALWGGDDLVVGISGFIGLVSGFFLVRLFGHVHRFDKHYQPVILRVPGHQQLIKF